jgi:hypothetical protein
MTKNVGEVAFLLGVPRRRVQWWIEMGWLLAEQRKAGRGYYFRVTSDEVTVAQRAMAELRRVREERFVDARASRALFARMRREHGGSQPQVAGQNTASGF